MSHAYQLVLKFSPISAYDSPMMMDAFSIAKTMEQDGMSINLNKVLAFGTEWKATSDGDVASKPASPRECESKLHGLCLQYIP